MRSTNLDHFTTALLLRSLGIDPRFFEHGLEGLCPEPERMEKLRDEFRRVAGRRAFDAERMGGKLCVPRPRASRCPCPHRYARDPLLPGRLPARIDLADIYSRNRRVKARKLERLMRKKPFVRQQVEMMLGGRILPDRRRDGKIRVMLFDVGGFGGKRGSSARVAASKLRQVRKFKHLMLRGFSKIHRKKGKRRNSVNAVLRDPALTVEDKVTLMIMLIMKKMDKNIEKQAKHINSLQQQQNGGGGAGGQGNSPSIDVETMKLKRLIDKRSQMFDMLRQIIDKYNQTAKGIIDSIGR